MGTRLDIMHGLTFKKRSQFNQKSIRILYSFLFYLSVYMTVFYFIPSSESSAYLKQIKCILSAVKKYRIFSLVTDTIFIFSL